MNNPDKISERDYLFDNLKALLIVLVVLVHLFAPVKKQFGANVWIDRFLVLACSFHMPLFVFISGYFSKNIQKGREKAGEILVLFFIGQLLIVLTRFLLYGEAITLSSLLKPQFSMWYLLALFLWRSSLGGLVRIRYILPVAFVLNILIMGTDLQTWCIRVVSFAFFFLAGYYTQKDTIGKIRRLPKAVPILALLVGVVSVEMVISGGIVSAGTLRAMMLRTITVDHFDGSPLYGYLGFAYIFVLAVLMCGVLLALFPSKKTCFSYLGQNSLTIYLGQAVLYIVFYRKIINLPMLAESALKAYLAATVLSVLCILIFGNDKASGGFNRAVKKIYALVRKPEEASR